MKNGCFADSPVTDNGATSDGFSVNDLVKHISSAEEQPSMCWRTREVRIKGKASKMTSQRLAEYAVSFGSVFRRLKRCDKCAVQNGHGVTLQSFAIGRQIWYDATGYEH